MKIEDAIKELRTRPVVSLWPTAATVLGISRSAVYEAAKRGEIDVLEVGRLKKAITAPLRRKLGIDAA
jgi:predicted DNA-binding transcriptional regulator AlpA